MMEMVQLTQKEIGILLELLEAQDLSDVGYPVHEIVTLHEKLISSQTF